MAKKRTGQDRPGKGSPDQIKSRIRNFSLPRTQDARNLSERSEATRVKSIHVLSDLRRDPELTFTQAAKNREISPSSVWRCVGSELKEDPSGRIRATKSDRLRATLHIPSTKPDVLIPIHTKSSSERQLVGEWFASINEAARGDFDRLNRFPNDIVIDGVQLPTDVHEVQQILEAMESAESPFEQLYVMAGGV
jgi:hypothetical protein